jgi:hypothetical protein
MSSTSIPLSALESGNGAKFNELGDKYAGTITALDRRQQTDMDNQPLTYKDGTPRMQLVITLEQDSGEAVQLYAKGGNYQPDVGSGESMQNAIGTAVRTAGAASLDAGGWLGVAFTGTQNLSAGKTAKLYTAEYRPPAPKVASIPAASLFGDS